MNLRNRLLLGMVALLTLQLLFVGFALSTLNQNNKAMEEILRERYVKINNINIIRYELNHISLSLHKASAGGHDPVEQVRIIDDSILNINSMLIRLEASVTTPEGLDILAKLETEYEDYQQVVIETTSYIQQGQSRELVNRLSDKEEALHSRISATVEEFRTLQEELMNEALDRSQASSVRMIRMLALFFILYLALSIGIAAWILRSMIGNISQVSSVISSAADQRTDMPRIKIDSRDELGVIAEAYNKMAEGIENLSRTERETAVYMQDRTWLSTNIAQLTTAFQDMHSPQQLGSYFISNICPRVEALYGVVYISHNDSAYYSRLALYAADASAAGPDSVRPGEGLIGQCALENRKILVEETPEDYIRISSGLGAGKPASLLVIPVEYGERVLAVVEIASFKPFSDLHQKLLDEIAGNLGAALFGLMQQMRVKDLLNESQLLNEELRVQAEELQSQSEEMQSQHEELKTINEQLEAYNLKSEQRRADLESIRLELQDKNEQLMQASQFKSEFLANISHELRTPLNSILILADILGQNLEANLHAKQVEFVRTIYNSGRDLLSLINQVLDLAKIESGKMDVNYSEISLAGWLDSVNNRSSLDASSKAIEFSVEADPDLPDIIYSDEQHLLHIVNNLLSNAFKFAPRGRVKLGLNRSRRLFSEEFPALRQAGVILEITVSDNGIGIPFEKQKVIFEPFMQANGATNRIYGGSGLGLSICRQTVNLLGGTIEVNSEPGKGSTFKVYIPCDIEALGYQIASGSDIAGLQDDNRQVGEGANNLLLGDLPEAEAGNTSEGEAGQALAEKVDLSGKTVLVVDDDMRNVFALTSVLESRNITVLFAENGQQAIEVLEHNPDIDLIIMDIMMPEMDGYDAIHNIRLMPSYQDLPIIALTAKAMKGDRLKCIEVGASDYMNKPVDIEQLFSLITVWLYK